MPDQSKKTVPFSPPPSAVLEKTAVLAAAKAKDRPVGGVPPVRVPPLDAEPLEGGGTMSEQARVLTDPRSPLSPDYDPDLQSATPPTRRGVRPPATTPEGPYRPQLSKQTVEGLEAIEQFRKEAEAAQAKAVAEAEAKAPDPQKKSDENIDELRTLFGDDVQWSVLNNPGRRRAIEERLAPLDIADILIHGEIRQEIVIIPDKLSVTFRSVTGEEDLSVKRLMGDENGADRYLMDKFSMMSLALAIVDINGTEFPTHMKDKRFDPELFKKKYERLIRLPMTMLADLGLQLFWFDRRVQSLFADHTGAIKNS